jgi:Flp pilus assembly protein TadG
MLTEFRSNTRGAVLVEFAICLPVLLVMYLGSFVVTDMVNCNRKVTIATRALADLASHNLSPSVVQQNPAATSATAYLSASAVVISPYNLANATEKVALLRICDATHAFVVWSQTTTQNGTNTMLTSPTTIGTPTAASVVAIPADMVTSPSIPVNPDGSAGICGNISASNGRRTQVGQAGGYVFEGQVSYLYTPAIKFGPTPTTQMADAIYMSPRLY